jgi:peptidoglycan-N-acetylglucosamine deacetylase
MVHGTERRRARLRSRHRLPVFSDPSQRRRRLLRIGAALSGTALAAWMSAFAVGLYFFDLLPERAQLDLLYQPFAAADPDGPESPEPAACEGIPLGSADALTGGPQVQVAAYLRVWPDGAVEALHERCGALDRIMAEWIGIDLGGARTEWLNDARSDAPLRALLDGAPGLGRELVALLPLPGRLAAEAGALDDPHLRRSVVADLVARAGPGTATVCLYPYRYDPRHREGLAAFLADLGAGLPPGTRSCLVAEADSPLWRDGMIAGAVDEVVLRAFREPDRGAPPAPLAPQPWFAALVAEASGAIGPDRLRIGLGAFGYLWTEGEADPQVVSFAEAMRLAARHRATVAVDASSLNTRITYADRHGARSEIWLLDALSMHNQLAALRAGDHDGVVLWSAGLEDPGVWTLLQRGPGLARAGALSEITLDGYVGHDGEGPFLRVEEAGRTGQREFFVDPATGLLTGLRYDPLPRPWTLARYGALPDRKVVALTFDDGPDRVHTAAILDSLRDAGVPATFFVTGAAGLRNPGLLRRMIAEGHEIGSHTFFHPRDDALGALRAQVELNAVQRLLASVTGHTTHLFRTPYGRSEGPLTAAEARVQQIIEDEGYFVAGADIVPRDWESWTARQIVDHVASGLSGSGGQVVVLHDAGGDRQATAEAVPILIERLRAEGYDFVPLADFLGLTRDEIMPRTSDGLGRVDAMTFAVLVSIGQALVWAFWLAIGLGLLRSVVVLVLALLRRPHPAGEQDAPLPVTVAIPAFNEEAVIVEGVAAALASDLPRLRVVVVDDGSTDGTAAVVRAAFGDDPRVRLIEQDNGGKWSALNAALRAIPRGVMVAIDADTLIAPDAARLLARHFADPAVGAVAGTVRVGNRARLLARLQALEYIVAQNVDRRAAERLNAMLVVPGAIGAWRVEAVRRAGLYTGDTITEDADLTVSILRGGWRVVFEPRAVSVTEVPETVPAFLRQRLRWIFGMMQTAWKHRRAARTAPGAGWFSIPDLWVTGVALGLLAPLADLVLVAVLAGAAVDMALGRPVVTGDAAPLMLAGWLALPLVDLLTALVAFGFARGERPALLLLVPLQRLLYRPLLYFTLYRAVARALAGRLAEWGKLIRLGTVPRQAG